MFGVGVVAVVSELGKVLGCPSGLVDDTEPRARRATFTGVPVAERNSATIRGHGGIPVRLTEAAVVRESVRYAASVLPRRRHGEDRAAAGTETCVLRADEVDRSPVARPRGARIPAAGHDLAMRTIEPHRRDAVLDSAVESDHRPVRRDRRGPLGHTRARQPDSPRAVHCDGVQVPATFENHSRGRRRRDLSTGRRDQRTRQQDQYSYRPPGGTRPASRVPHVRHTAIVSPMASCVSSNEQPHSPQRTARAVSAVVG